ncbi:MAG: creatininase family protein [Chitinophagaceae bacterium]|nr:creatininase family protein [Chitinophagaceae bacterium]
MRPYILEETNWKFIKDAKVELAVLPWGATEAHNYHLPYGTDNIQAERIAAAAAGIAWDRGAKVMVLPAVPFGVNTGQADILLDLNINPSTQTAILSDIIQVLNRQGIFKLIILNGHGGNNFVSILRELGLCYPSMFLSVCNWYQAVERAGFFAAPGDHADEMESSVMLYLKPEWVLPLTEAGDGAEKKLKIKAFTEKWAWTERRWSQVTADTGTGDPRAATAEKGERYFKAVTEKIGQLFIELAACDINDLYA